MKQGLRRFLFLLMPLMALSPAEAGASAVCEKLRERLARTSDVAVVGNSAEARQYSNAIAQRNFQIRQARNDLRQFGCSAGSVVIIGGREAGICGEIEDALAALEADKFELTRKRDEARANRPLGPEARQRILASLELNGCNSPEDDTRITSTEPEPFERMQADREEAIRRNDAMIAGLDEDPLDPVLEPTPGMSPLVGDGTRGGSLRTVCVRSCDGGFFPISSNATSLDFARDANTCAQMCPGIGTELFYHSIYSPEAADMISASTGRPYREMENAFVFRDRKAGEKSECGCDLSAYHQQMQQRDGSAPDKSRSSVIEIRTKTPPSTAAGSGDAQRPERDYDPADAKVRKVGPEFLSDGSATLDLTRPALAGAQPVQ